MILAQADDPIGKSGSLALQETSALQATDPKQKSGSLQALSLQDSM
jgi:hypothetical protein